MNKVTQLPKASDQAAQQNMYALFMEAPVAIAIFRGQQHIIELANSAVCEFWGRTPKEVYGKPLFEVLPEARQQGYEELLGAVLKTGQPYHANGVSVKLRRHKRLETVYFNFIYQPQHETDGAISGIIVIAQDITEQFLARKKAEQLAKTLERRTQKYEVLLAAVTDFVYSFDVEARFTYSNKPLLDLLGIRLEDIIGKDFYDLPYPPALADRLDYEIKKVFKTAKKLTNETSFTNPTGNTGYYEYIFAPVFDKKGKVYSVVGTTRDITKRKHIEEELKKSEERFRFMAESMPQKVFTANPNGEFDYFNTAWTDYTGLTFDQIRDWGWTQLIHPDDVEENIAQWQHSIDTGKSFWFEHRFKRHDGAYNWHLSRAEALKDSSGKVTMWVGSNTDIEEIKATDAVKKRAELLTKQRNALVKLNRIKSEFTGLASHQLRTPATAVKQYISLLIDEYAGEVNPDQLQYLQIAYDSNERQLNIINDLLKTVQLDSNSFKLNKLSQNIVAIVSEVIAQLKSVFELRNQTVTLDASDDSISAIVDAEEMKLVLTNLLENASKYTYQGKDIIVRITEKNHQVQISIIDQGVGINKEDRDRIFDKFTRVNNELSDTVSGSGLGLYWVKRIVKLHKGSVKVTSAPEKGSTFMICLPQ